MTLVEAWEITAASAGLKVKQDVVFLFRALTRTFIAFVLPVPTLILYLFHLADDKLQRLIILGYLFFQMGVLRLDFFQFLCLLFQLPLHSPLLLDDLGHFIFQSLIFDCQMFNMFFNR